MCRTLRTTFALHWLCDAGVGSYTSVMRLLPPHMIKIAEPPPPEGVSAESWDKRIGKLIERKPYLAGKYKKADGYRPSVLLNAVGKLKNKEETSDAAKAALGAGKVWGNLVSIAGDINAQPTRVGYGTFLSRIPYVIESSRNQSRAEKIVPLLKSLSPAERRAVSLNLRKQVAGEVAGSLSYSVLDTALAAARQSGVKLPPFTGLVAGKAVGHLVNSGVSAASSDEPLLTHQQASKYLKQLGVKETLYAGKEDSNASHYTGTKDPVLSGLREKLIERKLSDKNKGLGSQILREGGIILPLEKTKISKALWSKVSSNFQYNL